MSSPHRIFTAIPIANSSPNRRCRASVLYDDPTYNTCCTGHLRYPAGSLVLDVTCTPLRSSTNAWTIPNQSSSTVKSQSVADFSGKGGISSFSSFALTTHRRGFLLAEAVADSYRKDRKETGIAEVMVVARFEGDEALLEARVLIDRLAAY